MALVTVQRSPSPSNEAEDLGDGDEPEEDILIHSPQARSRSLSESYLAVKGAALILPQSECQRRITRGSQCGDIKHHLQSMFYLIRPQDTIKIAVKLESAHSQTRYLVVVSCNGRQDTDECAILGVDINDETSIGLVLPIWADIDIRLDGDGGFVVRSQDRSLVFKPVSVQAMWSALQCLHKVSEISREHYYFPGGLTHTWLCYYQSKVSSSRDYINEWEAMDDLMVFRHDKVVSTDSICLESEIRTRLKEIMMRVDLEEVTTRYLRMEVERSLGMDLKDYSSFIDEETMTILGQLDKPSKILDYLYLGSEWNASNLEELKKNGVGYILNVTREIDNFFPGMFEYLNIRVWDNTQSDLLKYWEKTYKFIKEAQLRGSKCLVHCKMGISRSAATVIAYLMKEFKWRVDEAVDFTLNIRSCINPNEQFKAQLLTYEGILDASNQRHNDLWKPDQAQTSMASHALRGSSPLPEDCDIVEEQGTLKEIAEEILASKYGKPPPNPFTFDEFELSSRSMDSIDECFPELPTSLSSDCDNNNIRLLYYRRLSDQLAEPIMDIYVEREQAASSSSDSSEITVAFYNCLRAHSVKTGLYHRNYSPIPQHRDYDDENNILCYREPWAVSQEDRVQQSRARFGSHSSANSSSDDERIQMKAVCVRKEPPVIDIGAAELLTESNTDSPRLSRRASPRRSPVPDKEEKTSSPVVCRRKKPKISTVHNDSNDESFEVFHIGDEEVVVKKGKVRRHTMNFEQLKMDPDAIPKENAEDEECEIPRRGVVKVQKEAFESRGYPSSPLSSSPKQVGATPPIDIPEISDVCELPSAGIVEFHRRSYEERKDLPKKTLKKVESYPDARRPDRLERVSKEELESGQVVQVRNLVHKFEKQSPVEGAPFDDVYSVSAPSSPSKLSRKNDQPHSDISSTMAPSSSGEPRVRKSHGRTHPLEHLTAPDPLTRNPFYKTM